MSDKLVIKLTESEYESFEETIASSTKGRAFLREHARRNRIMSTDEVKRIIYRLRDDMDGRDGTGAQSRLEVLRAELHDMAASIVETKRQIAALQPKDTGKNRIMAATGELDAIVSATERATSEIIAQAELLLAAAEDIRNDGDDANAVRVEASATEILMACSFQDITGQRTNKVVNAMRYLEHRINAMVSIWGGDGFSGRGEGDREIDENFDARPDAHLLNGPALEGEGVVQSDVDAIFDRTSPSGSAESRAKPDAAAAPPASSAALKDSPTAAKPAASGGQAAPSGSPMAQDDIDSLFN